MSDQGPCPTCGRYENRPVTVDAVVVRDGKVLLIQRARDPYRGYYALPGGFADVDEDTRTACVRELAEETGLRGIAERLLGVYDAPERDLRRHTVAIAYVVHVASDAAAQAGDDAGQVGWFDLEQLPPLAFDHARVVADYRATCAQPSAIGKTGQARRSNSPQAPSVQDGEGTDGSGGSGCASSRST